ncbi:Peptidoglycan-binding LysM domain-containing protein isoform 1 [Gossypium australe]|uniref:Peptidoglycan-binding LysM domain-containing protein isoform 1 n=1 Tax=Gossypium australe TaxID=47621 RepID=A0A5B6WML7_9ROSI|nr:Peptidoglycan-binding LysM domain-containing protein isoform 1 [Gossypium australe]
MQMERERRNSIANGDYSCYTNDKYSRFSNDYSVSENEKNQSLPSSSLPSAGFIEHPVSRFDTLAGVAIKYGVEVADIKKMNGLVTDLQMFALKTLQIPLPGRHPPSPCLSNGSETPGQSSANQSPGPNLPSDLRGSFQSLRLKTPPRRVSPAMSSLQGYYGLKPSEKSVASEGFEMAVYRKGEGNYLEDGPSLKLSSASDPPLKLHRKCRSVTNGFYDENGEIAADIISAAEVKDDPDKSNDKLIRRRQKSEADFNPRAPGKILKEDNTGNGGFSTITAKGLAQRSKAATRTNPGADAEVFGFNTTATGLGDGYVVDGFTAVRKSSSTSSLQDQDNSSLSSLWSTSKWNLKPDLQALSTVSITKPIFDGLPKPISARKNKAALD